MTRLLVLGVNRSGTSWVGSTLGATAGAVYVPEPDGDHDAFAYRVRRDQRSRPEPEQGAEGPAVERLWHGAFAGGRPSRDPRARLARWLYARTTVPQRWEAWLGGPETVTLRAVRRLARPRVAEPAARHVVVKSVRAELVAGWIVDRFRPRVLVVERDPRNVLASWHELGFVRDPREAEPLARLARQRWGVEPPDLHGSLLTRQAFTYGVRAGVLRDALNSHPRWRVVRHEDLCADPVPRFAALAAELGLEWDAAAERRVRAADRPGDGYVTHRVSAEQPDRWRTRLDAGQVEEIHAVLDRLPHDLIGSR
jgi:hypothetical protein